MRNFITVALLAIAASFLTGCTAFRVANAWLQSKADFVRCTADSRIYCEPGSEALAAAVAPLLPKAIETIEAAQFSVFSQPIEIYTYRSAEAFAAHSGATTTAGGAVSLQRLNLSPLLQKTPERIRGILIHELSHLHLQLQMGSIAWARVPSWFHEGLATWISGGGGAENVGADAAWQALRAGQRFEPDASQSPLFPKNAWHYGLQTQLYYRQAALFVDFLHDRDPEAFKQMLLAVAARSTFAEALSAAFLKPLPMLWQEFLATAPTAAPRQFCRDANPAAVCQTQVADRSAAVRSGVAPDFLPPRDAAFSAR